MSREVPSRRAAILVLAGAVAGGLVACSPQESADVGDPSAEAGSLASVCPATVVIQTDWYPTPERAAAYNLIGPDGELDTEHGTYSGEIGDTGVTAQVRIGGPFIGGQSVDAQMYTDTSITLGLMATGDAVRDYERFPTLGVVATVTKAPDILMWDPAKFSVDSWEDVKDTGAPVVYFEGVSFLDYLEYKGFISASQRDGSFDGTPSRFIVEDGKIFQQGYASNEPYRWENNVPQWGKPVDFLMVADSGYAPYPMAYSIRTADEEKLAPCLEQLVPIIQQSQVDYIADPEPINQAFLDIAAELGDGPPITADGNANAVKVMLDKGIVADSPDGTLGSFDIERLEELLATLGEVAEYTGKTAVDVEVSDIVTNDYIDPSIHL